MVAVFVLCCICHTILRHLALSLWQVFPHGLAALWESTGWPVMGHNRFWSHETPYAKQNGGDYEFEIGANDTMV